MRFTTILMLLPAFAAFGQSGADTVYFDKNWEKCSPDTFTYFRLIKKEKDVYVVKDCFKSGKTQMDGVYSSMEPKEVKDGKFVYYLESGIKSAESIYVKGKREGEYRSYDSTTGALRYTTQFKDNRWDGWHIKYYPNGNIWRKEFYDNGNREIGKLYDQNGTELKFYREEVLAEFPGGEEAMLAFIHKNLVYPKAARKAGIEGKVVVKFTVSVQGKLEDIHIKKSDHEILNDAALAVVKKMPKWRPAMIEGKVADISYILPFTFKLSDY